ncbi:hypothetical protein MHU86_6542 [Fragilaria crotonensis]|nr:hypothetical protein MHU86_6542 [Fragilaria crotonensis]
MCCRWHLNGKCVRSCFLSASHVALTTEQTASVRAWIEQCRARMRRPSSDSTPPSKKTKLGPSASAYTTTFFVAQPSRWSFDHEAAHREFHNRRTTGDAPPFRDSRQPTDGPIAGPSIAIPAAQPRPTATIATHETSLAAATPPRPARPPTTVRRGADRPALRTRTFVSRHDSWTPSGVLGPTSSGATRWTSGSRGRPTVQRGDTRIRISIRRAPGAAPLRTPALVALPRAHFRRRGFSLREISDADRLADVRDNLARGNHKSARGHEAKLISMLKKKWKGLATAPTEEAALELEGCEVAPLGMVAQTSIDEKGQTIEKLRLTRPVIQPQRDPRTKRKRQSGHVTTDDRTIWQGFQSTDVPHLVPQTIVAERTHPPHKGGLQIRLQTNTLKGTNRPEVLH